MDFSALRGDSGFKIWEDESPSQSPLSQVNLAPLKGIIESDPIRAKILRVLIEDGGWVTTGDLLKCARKVRKIVGAVTIGTILNGLNELVSSRLILSRTSLASGIDWAEWRLNPDLIGPLRKLLQMLSRPKMFHEREDRMMHISDSVQRLLTDE